MMLLNVEHRLDKAPPHVSLYIFGEELVLSL